MAYGDAKLMSSLSFTFEVKVCSCEGATFAGVLAECARFNSVLALKDFERYCTGTKGLLESTGHNFSEAGVC